MTRNNIYEHIKLDLQDLMLYRVHEILLVASSYDTFVLEEDGRLTEQIINEYLKMNFYESPRLWWAETGKKALKQFKERNFDVVILMMRIKDIDFLTLAREFRKLNPKIPIILLVFDIFETELISEESLKENIDKIFIWKGKPNVFPVMLKYIEDKKNAYRDIKLGGVRTIIFIEDNPIYYSRILPLLYQEIMFHTKNLIDTSLNDTKKLLHLRGRTKVLLASTYEEAEDYFNEYRENTIGVISDVRFPRNGVQSKKSGLEFSRFIRKHEPYMPVIIQSSNIEYEQKAYEVKADFLYKHSKTLLRDLRKFMLGNFGFGEFVFRDKKNDENARANDIPSLAKKLKSISDESLLFHSKYNHFSNWLANRGEFQIASEIRPYYVEDFKDLKELRAYLLERVNSIIHRKDQASIIEFSINRLKKNTPFLRIGKGSLGGKARGLLFQENVLTNSNINNKYPDIKLGIPRSIVIATDYFDEFIKDNNLLEKVIELNSDIEITKIFLKHLLPKKLVSDLKKYLKNVTYPLAVRSSSLLEDSQFQPLAGLYSTYMLPNSAEKLEDRLNQLCESIIRVYASTFFNEPKSLVSNTSYSIEEEKMAVLIMELIGQNFNGLYYPTISGIARNINYYPISYMEREEGTANIAMGFGKSVVEGEKSLRFSPKHPNILPQYFSVNETINASQNSAYALRLEHNPHLLITDESSNLVKIGLKEIEEHGQLFWAGSVVSIDDNIIREGLSRSGKRVITFSRILKYNHFPLSKILIHLLEMGRAALGNPVEIEFAVNLNRNPEKAELYLLQIRPMQHTMIHEFEQDQTIEEGQIISKSNVALGNGQISNVSYIIFIDTKDFKIDNTEVIAQEVEYFNKKLGRKNRYLLIGPGRWGTADPWLGIPVDWNQISNVAVIVEVGLPKLPIDPSFGTHFFQNITGQRIGYFTINPKNKKDVLREKILRNLPVLEQKEFTKLIKVDNPLTISINGTTGEGIIYFHHDEVMDEDQSSGI